VITIPVTTDTIEASETFKTWVTNAKISSCVRQVLQKWIGGKRVW
jgi:hypothetical protein